jgi:hypothetical protein
MVGVALACVQSIQADFGVGQRLSGQGHFHSTPDEFDVEFAPHRDCHPTRDKIARGFVSADR